ncbi:hypothetical protein [Planococcus halotolerans]|uniref:hypothetical protein n=1 Tax=Planococcus halotolerans TaxID=2233542 RepID=UPI001092B2E2|nr:hypothetical protein [Planococcus halotolerans]QHJ71622.1 hypothetical protein DNR44_013730 [Planococcus halotolerans]
MEFVDGMNDLEAVEYCIDMGIEEAKGLLETYKSADRFTNMKSVQALQKLLVTIHHDVELATNPKTNKPFSGKKRRHLVGDLRIERVKKEDGRESNSRKPTADDFILDEFIFSKLVKLNGGNRPLRNWVKEIELYNLYNVDKEEMKSLIENVHSEGIAFFNAVNVVNKFFDTIDKRNTSIVQSAINRLSKDNKIQSTIHYVFKGLDNDFINVSEELYEQVKSEVKELVEEMELNYNSYISQKINSQYKNVEYFECQKVVNKYLADNHKIQYFYKTIGIKILDKSLAREVSRSEMLEAYFNRPISLTLQKQKRKDYQDTRFVEKEFYRLNTFVLLDLIGIEVSQDIINEDKLTIKERSEQVYSNNSSYHTAISEKERAEAIKNSAF